MSTPDGFFATTRWTMVRQAGMSVENALEALCSSYWYPLYAYVRRHGFSKEDAEDLTQAFFAMLLERRDFTALKQENGRFRAFLLAALKNYLANERDRAGRKKRGSHITHFSLDLQSADSTFQIADATTIAPDAAYDREWAVALLGRVISRLQEEAVADSKAERFEHLKAYLTVGRSEIRYAEAAVSLGMDEGAVRVAVHRLRKRYRELLKDEVAQTLSDPAMVEEELAVLLGAFA
ncbi:MAG: sigma-70 family RNA polymerase sigma factor [Gloeobacteraceae cyanobacterium ES-bin-144]|nr:sigma-70 family RNA polymerase sigma factor [Verrucomicrobiales bacterium]